VTGRNRLCHRAGGICIAHLTIETLAYQVLSIISRIQHDKLARMTRDYIRSEIQIQIERIERSIRDFEMRKITYQEAEQISLDANALIEKLRAVHMDFSSRSLDTIPCSTLSFESKNVNFAKAKAPFE
jgi:hypothetical protein